MGSIAILPELPPLIMTFVDATVLTVLVFPFLYFLLLRPLITNISDRKQTQQLLQEAHKKMTIAVEERTGELASANLQLKKEIEGHRQTAAQLQIELQKSKKREEEVVGLLAAAQTVLVHDDFRTISVERLSLLIQLVIVNQNWLIKRSL
jgi:C4-dicarboxylate-specific signal transduction histidine kinase